MSTASVAVEPFPDESIPSMVRRLARFLNVPVCTLYRGPTRRITHTAVLEEIAAVLGVPAPQLKEHDLTWRRLDGWPLIGIDYRPSGTLTCPGCGVETIWNELVLVSACDACELLLTDPSVPTDVPAPAEALALQRAFLRALQAPTPALVELMRCVQRLHRIWRHQPWGTSGEARWPSPGWVAAFAQQAWSASTSADETENLIATAMLTHLGAGTTSLQPPAQTDRVRLHRALRAFGLAELNIPAYVNARTSVLVGADETSELGRAIARALRLEVLHATRGSRPSSLEMNRRYGYNRHRPEIATYVHLLTETAAGLEILRHEATALAEDGVLDYAARRDGLRTLRRVPRSVLGHTSLEASPRNGQLAAAWIWLELTHGTLRESPHHAAIRGDVRRLDRALRPEDRLTLIEHGHAYVGAVADDIARSTATTAAQQERTHGD
jgi:hypothetical protein